MIVGSSENPPNTTSSTADAAAPTVPSSVTSIVTLCLTSLSLRGSLLRICSKSPSSNAAFTPN